MIATIQTTDQHRRTLSALADTCRQIEKAESYQPQFRDAAYIESLRRHVAKLEGMLAESPF